MCVSEGDSIAASRHMQFKEINLFKNPEVPISFITRHLTATHIGAGIFSICFIFISKVGVERYRIVLILRQRVTSLQLCFPASLTAASTIKAEQINGYHIVQGGEIGPLQAYQSEQMCV